MSVKNKSNRRRCLGAAASVLLCCRVHAQTPPPSPPPAPADDSLTEIVVTGTQLRGVGPVGSTVITVDQQDMINSGLSTTSDILHAVPQVTNIGAGEGNTGSSANNAFLNTTGANAVNLRGLGTQATLVLFDGRRVAPGGEGAQLFDVSSIPAIALQRIDVVADGASATYGSDAVAGVVNLILRKDFTGLEMDARYGGASDYDDKQFSFIAGQHWGDTSGMISMLYQEHTALAESARSSLYNCNETIYGVPGASNNCSPSSLPGNVTDPATGVVYGLPHGSGVGLTPAQLSATNNGEPGYAGHDGIPKLERFALVGNVTQHFSDDLDGWVEGYFTNRQYDYGNGELNLGGASVPNTNPYYITFPGSTAPEAVETALGTQERSGYERSGQATFGVNARLPGNWHFDAYGLYDVDQELTDTPTVNQGLLNAALADASPASALNVFGSSINSAALPSIVGLTAQKSEYKIWLLNAKLNGSLATLPGGDVKLAIGGEYHSDTFTQDESGNFTTASLADTVQITSDHASRTVTSGFGELLVPIVGSGNALPFVKRLDFDVAGRFDHYSDVGNTTNPKVGLNWEPNADLLIHASYGTSFRAPNLCDISPACTSAVFPEQLPFGNVLMLLGGNSQLTPEKATNYSIGGDFHPQWVPGLVATINYFHIDYKNLIDTPCAFAFGQLHNPLYAFCVTANPTVAQADAVLALPWATGSPFPASATNFILDGRRLNAGEIIDDGLDLSLYYRVDNDAGNWVIGANGTYQLNYYYAVVPGSALLQDVNTLNYPLRFRGRGEAGWSLNGLGANLFVNYSTSYDDALPPSPAVGTQGVKHYTTVDARLSYNTGDTPTWGGAYSRNFIVSLSATNLFNARPPFVLSGTAQEYDSNVANQIGRMITIDLRKRF